MADKSKQPEAAAAPPAAAAAAAAAGAPAKPKLEKLKMKSLDGELFELELDVARMFQTIKTMIDDLDIRDDKPIELRNISSQTLHKIIEWANYHRTDPPYPDDEESREQRRLEEITGWDHVFIGQLDQTLLFDLIVASNFLDIRGLLDLTCKAAANLIRGRTVEEIRKKFNIKNDFTAQEEEQLMRENAWAEAE